MGKKKTKRKSGTMLFKPSSPTVVVPFPRKEPRIRNHNTPHGLDIDLRLNTNYDFQPIEVVTYDPWYEESRPYYPTQWMHRRHPYWRQFLDRPVEYWDGQVYDLWSVIDGASVELKVSPYGVILATRCGVQVILQYEDEESEEHPKLERLRRMKARTPQRYRKKEPCINTLDIPKECPYWNEVLSGLLSPVRGLTYWTRSRYDEVKCAVLF